MNMKRLRLSLVFVFVFIALILNSSVKGLAKERSEIPAEYKWDLSVLYQNPDALKQAKAAFQKDAEKLASFKGRLGESAEVLKQALDLVYDLEKRMRRMELYSSRLTDQDARVSENKAVQNEISAMRSTFAEQTSFVEPEIVSIDEKKLSGFFTAEPGLMIYKFPISETIRRKAYVLSPKEEKILAGASDVLGSPMSVYSTFTNADLPHETITLADGSKVKLDYSNYDKLRESPVEADRVLTFKTFFGQYDRFKRTLAEVLYSQMKAHRFVANSRGYPDTLAAALNYDGIDTKIYTSLIEAAHRNLPTLHRYLKLKARALSKKKLEYTDMYLPFTAKLGITVPYDHARTMLLEAFKPLGAEYVNTVQTAFKSGWVDVYPNEGKDPGGYSDGSAYGAHPYILMNYNDNYGAALTLAHEMGHSMHSYLSNKAQPFPTSSYSTFVAEVASTFNENLLNDYMLKKVQSDDERLFILGNFLDGSIKGTFFRQIQFAEFELLIHQKVEKGESLTDEVLNKIFLDLVRIYYGHDKGIVNVPDFIAGEWSIVPHFYYDYYVYQYSTSIAAASLLSQKVIKNEKGSLERYLTLIHSGGSDNPVLLLKNAGADMTNPDAYNALMERANRYMDEVEKILAKKGK